MSKSPYSAASATNPEVVSCEEGNEAGQKSCRGEGEKEESHEGSLEEGRRVVAETCSVEGLVGTLARLMRKESQLPSTGNK